MIRAFSSASIAMLAAGATMAQMPMDTDGDGAISLPELQAAWPDVTNERFVELDDNGDGLLSLDELRAARPDAGGRFRSRLDEIDTDGDGAISLPELQAATVERFNRMDANGDGLITSDERPERRARGWRRDHPGRPRTQEDDETS